MIYRLFTYVQQDANFVSIHLYVYSFGDALGGLPQGLFLVVPMWHVNQDLQHTECVLQPSKFFPYSETQCPVGSQIGCD